MREGNLSVPWILHRLLLLLRQCLAILIRQVIEERLRDRTEIVLLRVKLSLSEGRGTVERVPSYAPSPPSADSHR